MQYDINPIETAASLRLEELRDKAANRRLISQLNRQRRQARARRAIAWLRRALDTLETLLDERVQAAAQN